MRSIVTQVVDEDFEASLTRRLAVIEDELVKAAVADSPFVTEAARHIIDAGGKRFRPLLVNLGAHFGGEADETNLVRAALVVELTHVASLYHDDVMDDADLRRGAPSANRRWDNSIAILVGDYLLQHYLQVVADKTGSLIATSAVFGGMVAGAPQQVLDALGRFGEEIGVVFQRPTLDLDLSVAQNLRYAASLYDMRWPGERIEEVLGRRLAPPHVDLTLDPLPLAALRAPSEAASPMNAPGWDLMRAQPDALYLYRSVPSDSPKPTSASIHASINQSDFGRTR